MGKSRLDQWIWGKSASKVSHYHGDNVNCTADEYCKYCDDKGQTQIFRSWFPASEFASKICNTNHNIYVAYIYGAHLIKLDGERRWWSFLVVIFSETFGLALELAPKQGLGTNSIRIFTRIKSDYCDLLRCHVWGCPFFLFIIKATEWSEAPKMES